MPDPKPSNGHTTDITLHLPQNGNGARVSSPPRNGILASLKKLIKSKKQETNLKDAIDEIIQETGHAGDIPPHIQMAEHEHMLISNILELRDMPVVDVMVPRADITGVDANISFEDLFNLLTEKPHSRFPVYEDELDNVIGSVHMKDVVKMFLHREKFDLRDVMRNVLIVSPSMRVMDLLLQMRQSRLHLAMVVDEFGGIDGLITINDLIESIVGEIEDEHNFEVQPQLIERLDGTIVVDARYELDDFKEKYGEHLFDDEDFEDVDTMGGIVNAIAGHLPTRGEIIAHDGNGIEFEILDADPRRIKRIRIRNMPEPPGPETDE